MRKDWETEQLEEQREAARADLARIHKRDTGVLNRDDQAAWDDAQKRFEAADRGIVERRRNLERIRQISRSPANLEHGSDPGHLEPPRLNTPPDIGERTRDGLAAIDHQNSRGVLEERAAIRLDSLVRRDMTGVEARYLAAVSNPHYLSAFTRVVGRGIAGYQPTTVHNKLTDKEREAMREVGDASAERALVEGTGSLGGFAVPFELDPSVLMTSDSVRNPYRAIARVETVTSNEWRGVTSAGITASYDAEAAEVSDDSPTLGQPVAKVQMARAFVPFSIEVGSDWAGLQAELVKMLREAKDDLECAKFTTGLGTASNEPEGLLVGGTAVVITASAGTLAIADLYSVKAALPPRFQTNARWIGSSPVFDKVRQLTGPGSLTMSVWSDMPQQILRRAADEVSTYPTTVATGGSILTYGDFERFILLDRAGMSIEIISHLFGTAFNRPSGQRGAFAWWRSGSKVLNFQAFRTIKVS